MLLPILFATSDCTTATTASEGLADINARPNSAGTAGTEPPAAPRCPPPLDSRDRHMLGRQARYKVSIIPDIVSDNFSLLPTAREGFMKLLYNKLHLLP